MILGPAVLLGVIGLLIGSFLNVCIYRLPRHESVSWPGSHCTSCQRPLAWYENVPLFSWLLLRGRCRTCRVRISAQYPLVELTTALVFLGCYWVYGLTPVLAVMSGRDASNPAEATNPGRIRSAAVMAVPEAFRPSPANDWKTMSARPLKLLSRRAKKPT
jgi:prepilin signal peptidase PulO-like enzyme (type II secretory pathway)